MLFWKNNKESVAVNDENGVNNPSLHSDNRSKDDKHAYLNRAKNLRKVSWVALVVASSFLLIVSLVKPYTCLPEWLSNAISFLTAVATSVVAGALVTIIVDIPALVNSFKGLVIDSLLSNSYLDDLEIDRLKTLKIDVVKNIHRDSNLPDSMLLLDTKLNDAIDQAYYSFFNENVICHNQGAFETVSSQLAESVIRTLRVKDPEKKEEAPCEELKPSDKKYVLKDIENEFEIINPSKNEDTIVDIGIRKSLNIPKGITMNRMFQLLEFSVKIDNSEKIDIDVDVETFSRQSVTRSSAETMTYNSTLGVVIPNMDGYLTASNINTYKTNGSIDFKTREHDSPSRIEVKFKDSVKVKLRYRIIVEACDNHYTRRMRYCAQSFLLQYSCEDNVQIHGQALGTLFSQDKISILQSDDMKNHILIQCRDWLLPGNGIFVVLDDK